MLTFCYRVVTAAGNSSPFDGSNSHPRWPYMHGI